MTAATRIRPASDKQARFALSLLDQLGGDPYAQNLPGDLAERLFDLDGSGKLVTAQEASAIIDHLLDRRRAVWEAERAAAPKAKPGYYAHDINGVREFLVVVENKAKTNTYAKRLVVTEPDCADNQQYGTCACGCKTTARWEYAPGVGKTLAGLEPLTIEEAAEFGHLYGICAICAKTLTNPESVKRGIGPVCAKRLGG